MIDSFKSIIRYRGFITSSIRREFQSRYQSSILGPVWMFIQPISMILIYTIIFSTLMKARLPGNNDHFAYSIFLCSGIIIWNLFSEILNKSVTLFIRNANLLKKLSFPKMCLPVIVVLGSLLNFAILLGVFFVVLVFSGNVHLNSVVFVIPLVLLLTIFSISFGLITGIINVFFRDVGQFISVFMQFWFWLTPIVYPITILPRWAKEIVELNPITGIVVFSQKMFVYGDVSDFNQLIPAIIASIICSALCILLFKKRSKDMVDEL
jgi:lipopolysaccharide transport system permease protein